MRNLILALAVSVFSFAAIQAGDAPKAQAAATKADAKSCETCQVEVARRPLFGRRLATETVVVESTKKVTVLEPKKVMVEKTVMVPVTKEVKTATPVKVVKAPSCDCCEEVGGRRRLLGNKKAVVVNCK